MCARECKKKKKTRTKHHQAKGRRREGERRGEKRGGRKKERNEKLELELLSPLTTLVARERDNPTLSLFKKRKGARSFFFSAPASTRSSSPLREPADRVEKRGKKKRSREGGSTPSLPPLFRLFIARRRRGFPLFFFPTETRPALLSSNTLQRCRPLLRTTTMRRLVRWIWRRAEREKAKLRVAECSASRC